MNLTLSRVSWLKMKQTRMQENYNILRKGLLLLVLLVLAFAARAADDVDVFEDTTGGISFFEVSENPEWFSETDDTSFGFSESVYWIRVELRNPAGYTTTKVIQFDSLRLPEVFEFRKTDSGVAIRNSGFLVSQDARPMDTLITSFPVNVPANSSITTYYRIESAYKVDVGLEVRGQDEALAANSQILATGVAIFGGLIMLTCYNLVLAAFHGGRIYLAYSLFLICSVSVTVTHFRLYELLGFTTDSVVIEYYGGIAVFMSAYLFLGLLFKENQTRPTLALTWLAIAVVVGHLFVEPYAAIQSYSDWAGPLIYFGFTYIIINAHLQKNPLAKFVMVGWLTYVAASLLYVANLRGHVGSEFENVVSFANLFEGIVLSGVLAYRLRLLDKTQSTLREKEQLLHELEISRASIASTFEKQRELFAIVGHELRTPIAAISMIGRDADIDADSAREQIVEISENLLSVLEDLRVVVAPQRALESKTEQICDPVQTIKRALTPLSQLIKDNSFELRIDISKPEGVKFSLHAQPLRQVATNLAKNAIIHSGGSVVLVSFDYQLTPDGSLLGCLRVEDDGRGIPEELRERAFESFSRGDTKKDGSGLGLFISKEIASMMRGKLEYSTSQLGGACFMLTFPMKKVEVDEMPQLSNIPLKGLRILLAEDDAMLRMLTEKSLGKLGAQITSYDNGQKAFEAFDANQFDLVLTDLMMPIMDGHELTKKLRSIGSTTPIIGVTAAVIGDETDKWLKDGANAFIAKPITPEKLQYALALIGFAPAEAT